MGQLGPTTGFLFMFNIRIRFLNEKERHTISSFKIRTSRIGMAPVAGFNNKNIIYTTRHVEIAVEGFLRVFQLYQIQEPNYKGIRN